MVGIEYMKHLDDCRLIASRMVADVKLYPNSKVRHIVSVYWENLPRLKANQTTYVLELFKQWINSRLTKNTKALLAII